MTPRGSPLQSSSARKSKATSGGGGDTQAQFYSTERPGQSRFRRLGAHSASFWRTLPTFGDIGQY